MTNNDYIISIEGTQIVDNQEETIKLTTLGTYLKKGHTRYIIYDEYENEDIPTSKNILKIKNSNYITLIKSNNERSRLILEQNERHQCYYVLDSYPMVLGVYTNKININLDDNGGTVEVIYTLDINSTVTSYNKIYIKIRRASNNVKNINKN